MATEGDSHPSVGYEQFSMPNPCRASVHRRGFVHRVVTFSSNRLANILGKTIGVSRDTVPCDGQVQKVAGALVRIACAHCAEFHAQRRLDRARHHTWGIFKVHRDKTTFGPSGTRQ